MSNEKKTPIIKKVIKKKGGAHHGGSWKVAYADFVTAMMAFFLVMWLLAISSPQGRAELAEYVKNVKASDVIFNGGIPSNFEGGQGIMDGGCFSNPEGFEAPREKDANDSLEDSGDDPKTLTKADVAKSELSEKLILDTKEQLADLGEQIKIDIEPNGLRIQVTDLEGKALFNSGGAIASENAQKILKTIANRLTTIPNKIAIEGHTDSFTFKGQNYTNWELSTARATATRMILEKNGLSQERLTMVAGLAATQPFNKQDPTDPANRRISIMVYDEPEDQKEIFEQNSTNNLKTENDKIEQEKTKSNHLFLTPNEIEQRVLRDSLN